MKPPLRDPRVTMTILFCVLAAFCEGVDLQAAGVAASGIGAEFRPNPSQMGTFFSGSTLGLFFGALGGGRLADSFGRKKVLTTSVTLFGLFSLLTPLAWDMSSLSWARVLTGVGLGGALPNLIALVSERKEDGYLSGAVAMVYAATPMGGAMASFISLVQPVSSWRVIFVIGGLLPLLIAPFMAFRLPESVAFRRIHSDDPAKHTESTESVQTLGSVMAIFGAGRAIRSLLLWSSFFFELLVLYLLLNWLPTLLIGDGLTRVVAGGVQIGFNIGGAIAAVLIGHHMSRRGSHWSIIVTFLSGPILLFVLAKSPPVGAVIAVLVFVLGGAVIAAQAFLYVMAPLPYPTAIRGIGVGAAVAAGRMGSVVGPKLGGVLKSAGHDSSRLLLDLLPIMVIGSICALLLAWFSVGRTTGTAIRSAPRA
jgi:AAHS family 3-hydroxyphenylpropionic acid transporter